MSKQTVSSPEKSDENQQSMSFLKGNIREFGMLIALVVIMGFFQFLTHGVLLMPLNLTNLILQNSYIIIMAVGMLLVIVGGHIDLSVGSVVGFIGALAAVLMVNYNWHYFPTVLVCLVAGGIIGAAQGYWIAYYRIPAFIVTLAGMLVFKGLTLALLNGQSVGPFPEVFQKLSSGFIPDFFNFDGFHMTSFILGVGAAIFMTIASYRSRLKQQAHQLAVEPMQVFVIKNLLLTVAVSYLIYLLSTYQGLPNVLIIMALLICLYTLITNNTTIGRRIYAIGGNEKAAMLSGINTKRLTF